MPTFTRYDAPGLLAETTTEALDAWSDEFAHHTSQFAARFTHYFDPLAPDAPSAPGEVGAKSIVWSASPARLISQFTDPERWQIADENRDQQDEYCEWRIHRDDDGTLVSVTFTTEVPEYWSHLAEHDKPLLMDLYRELVDANVAETDLFDERGAYRRNNPWNHATSTGLAHLRQPSNTLLAAIKLAAESTVQRATSTGDRVTDRRELVVCGSLGEPLRNSDPQIADIINDAVFAGSAVTLASPLGLYLEPIQASGFRTPDGTDPASFWTPLRGAPGHTVRAKFEVPPDLGYVLGDLTVNGRPIAFGTQVADKVPVRIDAMLAADSQPVTTRACGQ